jgi:hypothetical protein
MQHICRFNLARGKYGGARDQNMGYEIAALSLAAGWKKTMFSRSVSFNSTTSLRTAGLLLSLSLS